MHNLTVPRRKQPISAVHGRTHHIPNIVAHNVWYGRPSLAADWPYCFRFPDFPRIMERWGSKCQLWIRKLAKVFVCSSNFRGHVWTPSGMCMCVCVSLCRRCQLRTRLRKFAVYCGRTCKL